MDVSPYLLVKKLLIKGLEKTYEATFQEGLNLIWGDMDCGKSSILNLIDFCLGGSNENLLYGEITAKARTAYLEVNLNGKTCTFERNIIDANAPIKVFVAEYANISDNFPMLMSASSTLQMPDGWVSDFILDSLGIAKVSIRESKVRDDAGSDRLSFRDLMKLMYLKQTKVGADSLLNYGNNAVFNKNIEIQKFVFNIHDNRISSLNQQLTLESTILRELKTSESSISKFLSDVNISVGALATEEAPLDDKNSELLELENSISKLKNDYKFATDVALSMAGKIVELKGSLAATRTEKHSLSKQHKNFAELKNTYQSDLECLNLSKITRGSLSKQHLQSMSLPCPLCTTPVSLASTVISDEDIDGEIRSIKNRISGTHTALEKLWNRKLEISDSEDKALETLSTLSTEFDRFNIDNISSLIMSIEAVEKAKLNVKIDIANIKRNIAISNKYSEIATKIDSKESVISGLKKSLRLVEEGLLGLDEVIAKLSGIFKKHMINSGLQNANGIFIDKKFIPHFRNISYYSSSSGGVRTITSIAGFVTRLKYLLQEPGNLPTFLMIDTPGQNIGRRGREDDDTADPALYNNIFKQIIEVTQKAEADSRICQVIIVDNDLPPALESGAKFHLVKRFRKKGGQFEKGLINDF